MRTTINIDDEILQKASELTGVKEKTSLDQTFYPHNIRPLLQSSTLKRITYQT